MVLHGENENYPLPSPRFVQTCRFFVDGGADAIVCHHSYVPSGMEIYQGVPIIYSTGNFIFEANGPKPDAWFSGYFVSLALQDGAIPEATLIPYSQWKNEKEVRLLDPDEKNLSYSISTRFQK